MLPDPKIRCPATGFARTCRSIVAAEDGSTCPKFVQIRGMDPQSGEHVDRFGCVDGFLPLLLVEIAQQTRQAGAATESFRNEVVRRTDENVQRQQEALRNVAARFSALPSK